MTTTRARPLTNAERQRRYRARRAAEYRQAVAEGRTLLHTYCRELVGDPARVAWRADNGMTCRYRFDRAAWLVANGMTAKRCRFVEEYTMIRRRYGTYATLRLPTGWPATRPGGQPCSAPSCAVCRACTGRFTGKPSAYVTAWPAAPLRRQNTSFAAILTRARRGGGCLIAAPRPERRPCRACNRPCTPLVGAETVVRSARFGDRK